MDPWFGKIPWRRERLPTPLFLGFPGDSVSKESTCNAGHLGSTPGLGRSPGEGNGYPLQYSGLENSMDRDAWPAIVHGVTKSRTRLSKFHFHSSELTVTQHNPLLPLEVRPPAPQTALPRRSLLLPHTSLSSPAPGAGPGQ